MSSIYNEDGSTYEFHPESQLNELYAQIEPLSTDSIVSIIEGSLVDTNCTILSNPYSEVESKLKELGEQFEYKLNVVIKEHLNEIKELYETTPEYYYKFEDFANAINQIKKYLDSCYAQCKLSIDSTNVSTKTESYSTSSPDRIVKKIISLSDICCRRVRELGNQITQIVQNNPNYTEYSLDVISIVAPSIAQQYGGIPMMAIVAALTVMCRKGIMKYVNGELHDI